jgi:hypothetical protein
MYQVVCTDAFGQTHDVPAEMMKLKSLGYGIIIDNGSVLLIQDKGTGMWEFPGGEMDKTLSEFEALKRNIMYTSGIIIAPGQKLVHIMEEDYFDVNVNDGLHATRMFFQLTAEGGALLTNGNGSSVIAAKYISLDEAKKFDDKRMKPKYRELLEKVKL